MTELAYKALKAARGVPSGRDAMRMMQKMGMKVDEIPDVSEVVIKTTSKDITIDGPSVTVVTVQGQRMYQIAGGNVSESPQQSAAPQTTAVQEISEADVRLVAEQTGKTLEESRKALSQTGGDLARAILLLKEQLS